MDTLNAGQARHLKCSQEVVNLLNKNEDKFATRKPIQKQVKALITNNNSINNLIPARSQDGEAATGEKKNLKEDIADRVNNICSFTGVYALEIGDATLYNAVSYTTSDVINLRDSEVIGFITTLVGVITPSSLQARFHGVRCHRRRPQ